MTGRCTVRAAAGGRLAVDAGSLCLPGPTGRHRRKLRACSAGSTWERTVVQGHDASRRHGGSRADPRHPARAQVPEPASGPPHIDLRRHRRRAQDSAEATEEPQGETAADRRNPPRRPPPQNRHRRPGRQPDPLGPRPSSRPRSDGFIPAGGLGARSDGSAGGTGFLGAGPSAA